MNSPVDQGALRAPRSVPTCVAVLAAASLLAGCSVGPIREEEPTTGLAMERAMAGGWDYDAMILRDRETGCRFTMLRDQPARPLLLSDGSQSGCRPANSAGQGPSGYEPEGRMHPQLNPESGEEGPPPAS